MNVDLTNKACVVAWGIYLSEISRFAGFSQSRDIGVENLANQIDLFEISTFVYSSRQ